MNASRAHKSRATYATHLAHNKRQTTIRMHLGSSQPQRLVANPRTLDKDCCLQLALLAMARSGSLLVSCALAAAFALAAGSVVLSFVGAPGAASHSLRQRTVDVAMHFGGGAPATTTPPPADTIADGTYVVGITLFFFASLVANVGGFFGPWSK
jgi:hypothetical protein